MRLEIGRENGKPRSMEEIGTVQHRRAVAAHAVEQEHRTATSAARGEPGLNGAPGAAREAYRRRAECRRSITDYAPRRTSHDTAGTPAEKHSRGKAPY